MTVAIKVKNINYEIGTPDFLYSFFSNVAFHLENEKWGSIYPVIMKEFYGGELSVGSLDVALGSLDLIHKSFDCIDSREAIWSFQDRSLVFPKEEMRAKDPKRLSEFFYTETNRDLFCLLRTAFRGAKRRSLPARVVRYNSDAEIFEV